MTITRDPWQLPVHAQPDVRLELVPPDLLDDLAAGRLDPPLPAPVSAHLAGPECAGLWRRRSRQIRETPADAPWITRLIIDPRLPEAVGLAGFHGAPDVAGMVEVGYRVDPARRRRGYARTALTTLLAVAREHPDVRTVRASISPDNTASLALATAHGFVAVGRQWDDEDGWEIVHELPATRPPLST